MTPLPGIALAMLPVLAPAVAAQDVVGTIRQGDAAAVAMALEQLEGPYPDDVPALVEILEGGAAADPQARSAAALAYALLGWWSTLNADVADALLDVVETGDADAATAVALLELGALGTADGPARAERWIAAEEPWLRAFGLDLLRRVGGDTATVRRAIRTALAADHADVRLQGARLVHEFESCDDDVVTAMAAGLAATEGDHERRTFLAAMVRSGAMDLPDLLDEPEFADPRLDRTIALWFARASRVTTERILDALPRMSPAQRRDAVPWLRGHVRAHGLAPRLVEGVDTFPEVTADIAILLASEYPGDEGLLGLWQNLVARTGTDTIEARRVACQALAGYGDEAAPMADLLMAAIEDGLAASSTAPTSRAIEPAVGTPLACCALYALGAIGPSAAAHLDAVRALTSHEDAAVAALARFAAARLAGEPRTVRPPRPIPPIEPVRLELGMGLETPLPNREPGTLSADTASKLADRMLAGAAPGRNAALLFAAEPLHAEAVPALLVALRTPGLVGWQATIGWREQPRPFGRLALPALTARLLDPPLPEVFEPEGGPAAIAFPPAPLEQVTELRRGLLMGAAPYRLTAPSTADLERAMLEAFRGLGDRAAPFAPILEWLAPRRGPEFAATAEALRG